jgi:hypothetical protein
VGANVVEVADGFHGGGGEDFAGGGAKDDAAIMAVAAQRPGLSDRASHGWACSDFEAAGSEAAVLGGALAVRDGPCATKPTPRVMRTMPASAPARWLRGARSGRKDFDDHVAECGGGEDEGEVGPGERGEIAGEEADEQGDAEGDPWGEDGGDERAGMCERDGRQVVMPRERQVSPSGAQTATSPGSCIGAAIGCGETLF